MGKLGNQIRLALYVLLIATGLALQAVPVSAQTGGEAFLIHIDGIIDPNRAKYLDRALGQARDADAQLAIVLVDTPGGQLSSMRAMVEDILASDIPVITFVGPQGAQAGSAGTFIAAAGHLAVMAPGSNIGAATPISGTNEDLPDTLANKVTNDAAALIRSIADTRGRNSVPYEATVREASSFTTNEALQLNMINFVADDLDDLLLQLDGLVVAVGDNQTTLQTRELSCQEPWLACKDIRLSWVEQMIGFIANPNISSILLTLGGLGIFIEFLNPGLLLPGIFGAIALVLAFVAFGNLPVNWAGVGLILFSLVLLYAELQVAGTGLLGIGAIVSFVFGVVFLLEPWAADPPSFAGPNFDPSPWLIGGLAGSIGVIFTLLTWLSWRGAGPSTTADLAAVLGKKGLVRRELNPRGSVIVDGQMWTAEEINGAFVGVGEQVAVEDLTGLTLRVKKRNPLLSQEAGPVLPEDGGPRSVNAPEEEGRIDGQERADVS